jgi:predicted  nucleic acid-binding Zn-ribbon protein
MKIISLLGEAFNQNKANLPLDKDILFKAKQKYPQYSGTQALTLYIADEMAEKEKVDSNQNRLIDTQRRENERLRGEVQSIGQELENFERQSIETDREVARLKQLSGMLTTGGASTQQNAKVSADALEKLQKDLATLKAKPGMDSKVFNELSSQVQSLSKNKSTDNEDVRKLQNIVKDIENQASVNYNSVARELNTTKQRLADKEARFKEYKSSFSDYKQSTSTQLEKFGTDMKNELEISRKLRAGIMQDAEDIDKMKTDLGKKIDFINSHLQKIANTEEPTAGAADAPWIMGGGQRQQNIRNNPANVQESIMYTEEYTPIPSRKYRNVKYDEWIRKHFLGLFNMFKGRFIEGLKQRPYSDKQIADILEEYIPLLYGLSDEKTPLTPKEVNPWMDAVKDKLWELSAEPELFTERLDKTYARMLDNIIGLDYIKKG